jgi:DNA-binding MarR family transcriptional regulator
MRQRTEDTMTETTPWYEDIVMPALLGWGRQAYGEAMRRALAEAGCEDMPPRGMFVIGSLAQGPGAGPLALLGRSLGVSKQAAGQLVDTMVLRGYVRREPDGEDRRRFSIKLTERGWHAAAVQREAGAKIDAELAARVGANGVAALRRALGALVEIGGEQGGGDRPPG